MSTSNSKILTIYDWLNYIATKNKHPILTHWINDKDSFYEKYFTSETDTSIIIFDKSTMNVTEFSKNQDSFIIKNDIPNISPTDNKVTTEKKLIFKFGNFEITKSYKK